jgi:cell division ATPase FtsA
MMQPFIGIDFGTCNSSAAWFNPRTGQAESLLSAEGDNRTPSVVYFGPNNETVVGKHAEDQMESPERRKRVRSAVKLDLAKQLKWHVGDRLVTPVIAAAEILGKIKRDAEKRQFHDPVTRAMITCPAKFDELQKDKLREAAKLAGFRDVELLAEPVAAALAYAADGMKADGHVLVYDLGGGTFDLALLAREEGEDGFRVAIEPAGERIGGEDFDRAIYDHFDGMVHAKYEQSICPDGRDIHLLRQCRKLRESLTAIEQPPALRWHWPGKGFLELPLTQARFERLVSTHVERTVRMTRTVLEYAAREGYPPDSVILIGGASRTPCIVRCLRDTLQIEPREWQKQDVAVSLGAAYHAQRLWGEELRRANGKQGLAEAAWQKTLHDEIKAEAEKERQQRAIDEAERRKKLEDEAKAKAQAEKERQQRAIDEAECQKKLEDEAKAKAQAEKERQQRVIDEAERRKKLEDQAKAQVEREQKQRAIDEAAQKQRLLQEAEAARKQKLLQEERDRGLQQILTVVKKTLAFSVALVICVILVTSFLFYGIWSVSRN